MSFITAQMARHLGTSGRIAEDQDKAVTVRPSSTALLSVDSLDRVQGVGGGTSGDFIINKNQSIFNGFFTRIALNEIVLDWCIDNVSDKYEPKNNVFQVLIGATTYTATLANGGYTAAEVIDSIVSLLNTAVGAGTFRLEDSAGAVWVAGTSTGPIYLATTAATNFTILPGALAASLGIQQGVIAVAFPIACPKILPIYYLDFVSPQLTYNQDLKDNTTSEIVRDVLYRWVLAYDNGPIPLDKYNFPIFQGYKPFISRRYLNYPKQILWNPAMPVGQLSFQVYTSYGEILSAEGLEGELEYQMALLFSEN